MYYNRKYIGKQTLALGIYFLVVILGVVNIPLLGGSVLKYVSLLPMTIGLFHLRKIHIIKKAKFFYIFYLFAIVTILWTIDYEESEKSAKSFLSFLVLTLLTTNYYYNEAEFSFLKKMLIWSSRVSLVVTWIFATYEEGRLLINNGSIQEDPNYLCSYFYFAIAAIFSYFLKTDKFKKRLMPLAEILIYLYTMFATGSRGGMLGAIVVMVVVFIVENKKMTFKYLLSLLVFALLGTFLLEYLLLYVDVTVMERFTADSIVESNGTGRYEIWKDAITTMSNSDLFRLLFGYGTASSVAVATEFEFTRINVMHNIFVEFLVGTGLIGLYLYTRQVVQLYKISKSDSFLLACLIGMIVLSLSTSITILKTYWNVILLILILGGSLKKTKKRI